MKNAAFAFAALLATSAFALASEAPKPKIDAEKCRATQSQSTTTIDCRSTGSTAKDLTNTKKAPAGAPRLGYEGDPWIVPNLH